MDTNSTELGVIDSEFFAYRGLKISANNYSYLHDVALCANPIFCAMISNESILGKNNKARGGNEQWETGKFNRGAGAGPNCEHCDRECR
jgi:hypothetical protein